MKFSEWLRGIGMSLLAIVVIVGLSWLATGNALVLYRYFAPKQEAARRDVFENTKAYSQGMVQELQNMQFEYVQADDDHKQALASIILHRAADFPPERMPEDLRQFIDELKTSR